MDPLTQGLLGASAAQNLSPPRRYAVAAATLGFLSGMAADLDVLIRSPHDSLLFLEFHRQFTHSLVFIPVGALLCAAVLRLFFRRRWPMSFGRSALFCGAGYATHALLDACTTYGTQLLWPFSDTRIAWNIAFHLIKNQQPHLNSLENHLEHLISYFRRLPEQNQIWRTNIFHSDRVAVAFLVHNIQAVLQQCAVYHLVMALDAILKNLQFHVTSETGRQGLN